MRYLPNIQIVPPSIVEKKKPKPPRKNKIVNSTKEKNQTQNIGNNYENKTT